MADQHSNEHMSRDNVADGSVEPESTVVTSQHSDEGVDIADVVLESLKSKGIEDNKNSDENATMGKETVVADKNSDKGERIAEVALESLKSKDVADKRSDDQGENIDEVALDSMKDKRSDESERIAEVALETLKSKAVADQRSNEDENTADQTALEKLKSKDVAGESIAEVVIGTLKSKGIADKDSDEGAVKTNATVKSSESTGSNSQSTLEINVKTLDSQLHSFTVNKNMPVSIFKETIASDVGLPVEQQRLIFRGKALKDEDRLSEYHIESGHTLHLVETTARSSNTGQDDNVTSTRPHVGHVSHSVVLGTFGVGDQDEGSNPDVNQVIGAVLNFLGNENGNQSQPGSSTQSMPQGAQIAVPAVPTLATPIPESLHTLSEFMNHMERALSQNSSHQPSDAREGVPSVELPSNSRGLPSPAALAVVMRHAQRLLSGPAVDSLSQTARRLEEEEGSSDVTVRTRIQTEVVQSGLAMQHLGALLLELGRTMLTLRIGQSPAESSVNAGPAVYISPSGPNPIMVQPFPLQTSSLFGDDTTSATMNRGPFGPVGIGPVSRHLNIHIHSGSRVTNVGSNQGAHANMNAGINSQTRGVGDHIGSGNQSSLGQANAALPEVRTDAGGTRNAANSSARMKSLSETEGGSSSARRNIPLGLGPGGLQPKRHRQTRSEAGSSSVSTPYANQNLPSPGGQQLDPATIINQAVQNPALNNLLAGVSNQPGAGSQDFFRNLMSQLAHNPQMMNTVNQFANQMDGNQDLNSMMAGMGGSGASGGPGGSGASGSGKFSSLVHQMMPFITQSLNSGNSGSGSGSGSSSKLLQSVPSRKGTLHRRNSSVKSLNIKERSSDFQMNLENAAQKIVEHYPPLEIFSSVVETAAALRHNVYDTSAISDLCMEEELAQEFIEMLKRDIGRRLQ